MATTTILRHIDRATNEIKIIGDGAVPPSLANEDGASLATHGIPTEGEAGGDVDAVVANWNNEYACLGYGEDLYEQIIAFGELMDIKVLAF